MRPKALSGRVGGGGGGGGGEGQQCKHTNCLKHKGGMQTHKLNNLMQDQSL